jgi:hypothetical protein
LGVLRIVAFVAVTLGAILLARPDGTQGEGREARDRQSRPRT